jgi:hypothetical protein
MRSHRQPSRIASIVHYLTLLAGFGVLLRENRSQWFFGDEWEFIVNRVLPSPRYGTLSSLFAPHNEHWSTLPILVYRMLTGVFGLQSYLPFVITLVLLHLALTHVLWRLSMRAGALPGVATAVCAAFTVFGAGAQNLLWAFQMGFIATLLFGWLQVWASDHNRTFGIRDGVGWLAGAAALMCTANGIPIVAVAGICTWLRRGWRDALLTVSVPVAVFPSWYLAIGHRGTVGFGRTAITGLPSYVMTGIVNAFGRSSGIPESGAVLALALTAGLALRWREVRPNASPAYAGAIGVALFWCFVGLGRAKFGDAEATASRYVYMSFALALPAVGLAISWLVSRTLNTAVAATCIGLFLVAVNLQLLHEAAGAQAVRAQQIKSEILAASLLVSSGQPLVESSLPEPTFNPDLTVPALREINRRKWLPRKNVSTPSLLTARGRLQTELLPAGPPDRATVLGLSGAQRSVLPGSCLRATPTSSQPRLVLAAPPGSALRVSLLSASGGNMTVALQSSTATGDAASILLPAHQPSTLAILASNVKAILTLPVSGPTMICTKPS